MRAAYGFTVYAYITIIYHLYAMLMFVIVCAKVVNYINYYVAVSIRLREVLTHQSLPVTHERQPPRCKF